MSSSSRDDEKSCKKIRNMGLLNLNVLLFPNPLSGPNKTHGNTTARLSGAMVHATVGVG
jgi:hypothetical protein